MTPFQLQNPETEKKTITRSDKHNLHPFPCNSDQNINLKSFLEFQVDTFQTVSTLRFSMNSPSSPVQTHTI